MYCPYETLYPKHIDCDFPVTSSVKILTGAGLRGRFKVTEGRIASLECGVSLIEEDEGRVSPDSVSRRMAALQEIMLNGREYRKSEEAQNWLRETLR